MVRAFVLYESEPDPERYERHAELCRRVPGSTFRHGKVFGAPMGEPAYAYYAEWEFPDRDAFKEAARSEECMVTGGCGREMGGRFHVLFAAASRASASLRLIGRCLPRRWVSSGSSTRRRRRGR